MKRLAHLKTKLIVLAVVFLLFFGVICVMGFISIIAGASSAQNEIEQAATGLSAEVEQYRSLVDSMAEKYGIKEYTNHLLCLMQEETSGKGTDVINAGSFVYNIKFVKERGAILNPNYSIECGIREFSDLLSLAGVENVNDTIHLLIVYQAYHSDRGYIDFALNNGGYTAENAQSYLTTHSYPPYTNNAFAEAVNFWYQRVTAGSSDFIYPLTSRTISSPFGKRTPNDIVTAEHGGVDFPAPEGTPVFASADGIVIFSQWDNYGAGYCVKIQHSATHTTLYAHNSRLLVNQGDTVKQGDVIALVGSTGRSTGPHCHFELRINGEKVDPIPYLDVEKTAPLTSKNSLS